MHRQRSTPIAETAGSVARPAEGRLDARKSEATPGKGKSFRRKIDCGSSTETSAERLVLRDPGHILRSRRRPDR